MSRFDGFSDSQARALVAELGKLRAELHAEYAQAGRVLDRRGSLGPIRPRPGDFVRVIAGDQVVLPHPRVCAGRALTVLVEGAPASVVAEASTVNDVARLTVTSLGAMAFYCTGTEWWGSAVGGAGGGGGGTDPIPDQTVLGNDSGVTAAPTPVTIHQELDWIPGVTGSAWIFSGTNIATVGDFLDVDPTDAYTLGIWLEASAFNGGEPIRKYDVNGRGYALQLTAANRVRFYLGTAFAGSAGISVDSTGTLSAGKHFVTVGIDGSGVAAGVTIHIDGVLQVNIVNNNALAGGATTNTANLQFGVFSNATTVTDAAKWGVRLTTAQVLEAYGAGAPPDLNSLPTAPAPQGWWRFDSSDTVAAGGIADHATGNHDATAGGGLAPTAIGSIGIIPVRGASVWTTVAPGTSGLALTSNGVNTLPTYRQIGTNGLPAYAAESFLGNFTAGSAVPTARAGTSVAGAGLTYAAGGTLAVGSSTSITVNADDIQRPALTGFAAAAANSNATTSAEPIVTYSASANMSAERVTTSSTSVTVDTSVANQIEFRSAAKTGDVTSPANSNANTIANDAVTNAKADNMPANTVKANPTTGSADPQDVAMATNTVLARASGNIVALAVGADTGMASINEGATASGLAAQTREDMQRWLSSTGVVTVFEEEFQGNLAGTTARWTATAGYTLSESTTTNAESWGLLGVTQTVGNVAAAMTLGASESAANFRHEKVRYVCVVLRTSTAITADTAFAVGLLGPFNTYGGGLQGRIAGTTEGRFFSYNTALSANWHVGYRSGSATSVTDSTVAAADTTRYVFEWFTDSAGVTYMYVNGALVRTDGAGNGPAAGAATVYVSSLGSTAAARSWQLDYVKVVSQTANRFG